MTAPLVNGRFLARRPTGVDRFAIETIRGLVGLSDGATKVSAVVPGRTVVPVGFDAGGASIVRHGSLDGHAWEQFELRAYETDRMLIGLCNTGPVLRERQLVVVHDAATFATPENYGVAFRTWYRVMLAGLARRSRRLATVSRFSADQLARHLGVSPARFEVVPESGEHMLRYEPDRRVIDRLGLTDRPYVLAVGGYARNKNLRTAVAAMASLARQDVTLVVAGSADTRIFAARQDSTIRALATGYVTDPELRALYVGARCFVFPSLYEGFGLPPLEAMTCGCPVVCSSAASMPEVCGNAAMYFDPLDATALSKRLADVLASRTTRDELIEAGLRRAAQFRWQDAARAIADLAADG